MLPSQRRPWDGEASLSTAIPYLQATQILLIFARISPPPQPQCRGGGSRGRKAANCSCRRPFPMHPHRRGHTRRLSHWLPPDCLSTPSPLPSRHKTTQKSEASPSRMLFALLLASLAAPSVAWTAFADKAAMPTIEGTSLRCIPFPPTPHPSCGPPPPHPPANHPGHAASKGRRRLRHGLIGPPCAGMTSSCRSSTTMSTFA